MNQILGKEKEILLEEPLKDIAQFLGTTYRHLNRTLHELEHHGIIRCEDRKIYLLDEEKLQELAKNDYLTSL
jgi:CRP-like cAMP-binding protein